MDKAAPLLLGATAPLLLLAPAAPELLATTPELLRAAPELLATAPELLATAPELLLATAPELLRAAPELLPGLVAANVLLIVIDAENVEFAHWYLNTLLLLWSATIKKTPGKVSS